MTYVQRFSSDGRCVTNLPGLWSEDDIEITQTQFNHPSITSGQHTNGPANIFWRNPEGAGGPAKRAAIAASNDDGVAEWAFGA